ncbi:hypothetical protein E1B28_004738 [Marasmius oreades]|uniref:tRNA (guanine(9)-N1)-methyltransferase n=1 Tax=Marasmius oreades TaxID=181124 RepID=A0A9P7UZA0_9AGAR|nr:uncharacterized protein E1B28_004738 [Marasmius oreades]KAG7097388.1 hypothetical protein E1B28_004738 [Marasmius oreades]
MTSTDDDALIVSEPVQVSGDVIDAVMGPSSEPTLSKSAMKKTARKQALQEHKKERRAREKEMRKEKKKTLHQKRLAGELDEDEKALLEQRRKKRRKLEPFGGRVVVDLGFDEKMSEKEISSLTSQLAYMYSGNRNASFPFSLIYTSLDGRTYDRLEAMSDAAYKRWSQTEWWREGYEKLWIGSGSAANAENPTSGVKEKVVYLTADSDEELAELNSEEIYIIGGIVDHNRYKNLCLNRAKEAGIRTARLPIGRYVASLPTRKVLTVNQVFEIMLKWVETKNWEDAFYSIIPKRKFQGKGKDVTELMTDNVASENAINELAPVAVAETIEGDTIAAEDLGEEPSILELDEDRARSLKTADDGTKHKTSSS